jgi:hypothetical protein
MITVLVYVFSILFIVYSYLLKKIHCKTASGRPFRGNIQGVVSTGEESSMGATVLRTFHRDNMWSWKMGTLMILSCVGLDRCASVCF